MKALGLDVSHWEKHIDWGLAAENPHSEFVFMKATEGTEYVDDFFTHNWTGVKDFGRLRSPFHFASKDENGLLQAEHFYNTILSQTDKKWDLAPCIDLEDEYQVPHSWYMANKISFWTIVDQLIDATIDLFEEDPIIYSNVGFLDDISPPDFLAEFPLWVANTGVIAPTLPLPWRKYRKTWLFWQYRFDLRIPGINAAVDGNYFFGNSDQLAEYAATRKLPAEYIPNIPALAQVKTNLFIRKEPGKTLYNATGKIYPLSGFNPEVMILQLAPDKYGADRLWGRIGNNIWVCVKEGAYWYIEWL